MKIITLKYSVDRIPTVNNYFIRYRNGNTALNPKIVNYKKEIQEQTTKQFTEFNENMYFLYDDTKSPLILELNAYLNYRYLTRDLSNILKHTEDAVYKALEVNDARNIQIILRKYDIKGEKQERIVIHIKPFEM